MLRLTKLTDYGILLMTHLATSESPVHTASGLAEATRVPLPTVSKILQMLLHGDLLVSQRGANGGYRLATPAGEITLGRIIDALEGSIALTECNLEACACEQQPYCSASGNWKRINEALRRVLDTISLAEMASTDFVPIFRVEKRRAETEIRDAGEAATTGVEA